MNLTLTAEQVAATTEWLIRFTDHFVKEVKYIQNDPSFNDKRPIIVEIYFINGEKRWATFVANGEISDEYIATKIS